MFKMSRSPHKIVNSFFTAFILIRQVIVEKSDIPGYQRMLSISIIPRKKMLKQERPLESLHSQNSPAIVKQIDECFRYKNQLSASAKLRFALNAQNILGATYVLNYSARS